MWSNNDSSNINCSDPRKLYENFIVKPLYDVIADFTIHTYTGKQYDSNNQLDTLWSITEVRNLYGQEIDQGRCFTVLPSNEILKEGVKDIFLRFLGQTPFQTTVYFHQPGYLNSNRQKTYVKVDRGHNIQTIVEYEVMQMLAFQDEQCILYENYNRDFCIHQELHQVCKFGIKINP